MSARIALLIDAENVSHSNLPRILAVTTPRGELAIKAVYADWNNPSMQKWHELATDNKFKIRHQRSAVKAKNASDMRLIMDAIEILHYVRPDIFCLVSNDADYVPLCDKLHESGKYVIGLGYNHAAEALIRACDEFIFIARSSTASLPRILPLKPVAVKQTSTLPKLPQPPSKPPAIRKLLADAFARATPDAAGWVTLSALGTALLRLQADFKTKSYGHATLSKLLQGMSDFVELSGSGKSARVKNSSNDSAAQHNLRNILIRAFATAPKDVNRWVTLSALGTALLQLRADFKPDLLGHATLPEVLQDMPDFVELKANGMVKSARLKNNNTAQDKLRQLLTDAFAKTAPDAAGWVTLSALGTALLQVQANFKTKSYGQATLSKLLQGMPDFVELKANGLLKSARLK